MRPQGPHSDDETTHKDTQRNGPETANRDAIRSRETGKPVSGDTPHVYMEPVLNRKASHDAMVAGIVSVWGFNQTSMTETEWGRVHKAAKLLVDVDASPSQLAGALATYRTRYPSVAYTPLAVAGRWSEVTTPALCPHTAKAWTLTDDDGEPVEVLRCGDCRTELDRRVA